LSANVAPHIFTQEHVELEYLSHDPARGKEVKLEQGYIKCEHVLIDLVRLADRYEGKGDTGKGKFGCSRKQCSDKGNMLRDGG